MDPEGTQRADSGRADLDFYRDISPDDEMCRRSVEGYYRFGLAALDCIDLALEAAGAPAPRTILDLPSGHGRVLRMLHAAFPEARITACDLDRSAVDWCARHLGAVPVYSEVHPTTLSFEDRFDLIWCGSLMTHIDAPRWHEFLDLFTRSLSPDGVLIFTTAGRLIADEVRSGRRRFPVVDLTRLVDSFDRLGFGYEDYRDEEEYGSSLSSPSWVCSRLEDHPELELVLYTERGWSRRQDVVACAQTSGRTGPSGSPRINPEP